jgi:hypothetical protein
MAMEFKPDLLRKEEGVLPEIRQCRALLKEEQVRWCKEWVGHVVDDGTEVGVNSNSFTWGSHPRTAEQRSI